jgi:tryptophan synthase alpha chain
VGIELSNKRFFVPFIMCGDPTIEATLAIVDVLVAEGADIVELGVPFTDPLADGPVIQLAAERGIKNCPSLQSTLDVLRKIRERHPKLPVVVFTYANPVFRMGFAKAASAMRAAGASAVLVVDLPPEEASEHIQAMRAQDIDTVFLASPTTTPARLKLVGEASRGFVYYVSRLGVTGAQRELSASLGEEVARVRAATKIPIAVGFGVSNGAQARSVAGLADGVIVGSAIVERIGKAKSGSERVDSVRALVRELVAGVRG